MAGLPFQPPTVLGDQFVRALIRARDRASHFVETTIFPHFTDHGIGHLDRVAQNFLKLAGHNLGTPEALNEYELFVGLAACYLHDVAMQSSLGITKSAPGEFSTADLEEIRRRHGPAAAEWIRESVSDEPPRHADIPRRDLGLTQDDETRKLAPFIATICEHHSGEPTGLERFQDEPHQGKKIRVRLLLHLVRLADGLDADAQRVNMANLEKWRPTPKSLFHWWRHHYTASVDIDPRGTIRVTMRFPEKLARPYVDLFRDQTYDYIQKELKLGKGVFRDHEIFPELEPIVVSTLHSEGQKLLPDELKRLIDSEYLAEPAAPGPARGTRQTSVFAPTSHRDKVLQGWGIAGDPWGDLPAAYSERQFIETTTMGELFHQLDALTKSERGELRLVFGSRGAGKTSFLLSARTRFKDTAYTVYVDLQQSLTPVTTVQELYNRVFQEILEQLTERPLEIKEPGRDDFLKALEAFHVKKPIVLVDNLDRYSEKPEVELIRRFFEVSQGVWQTLKRKALVVISATDEWRNDLSTKNLGYIGRPSFWDLRPFTPAEVRQLLDNRLRIAGSSYDRVFDDKAFEVIHKVAAGNPRHVLHTCSSLFREVDRLEQERITSVFVKEVFSKDLGNRVTTAVLNVARESSALADGLESIYMYHLYVERAGPSADNAWNLFSRLLASGRVAAGEVPEQLAEGVRRVADQQSDLKGKDAKEREERWWEPRKEVKAFLAALKSRQVSQAEFVSFYRAKPVAPPGVEHGALVKTFMEKITNQRAREALERAERYVAEALKEPPTNPLKILLKARFALECFVAGFLLARNVELPGYYILRHDDGYFEVEGGLRKHKSPLRLANEMDDLMALFELHKSTFVEALPEMRLIQTRSRRYFMEAGYAATLSVEDGRILAAAIKKIGQEVIQMAAGMDRKREPLGVRPRSAPPIRFSGPARRGSRGAQQ